MHEEHSDGGQSSPSHWRQQALVGAFALAVAGMALWGLAHDASPPGVPVSRVTPTVRCADFRSQAAAQRAFTSGVRQLDGDGDALACEALP